MEYFIFNGKYFTEKAGILSANSRGLRFGDGLFETLKSNNGLVAFIDEHFARLWKGLQVLQFNIPKHFTPDHLQEEIAKLLNKNGHHNMARIRLTIFRGDGGLYDEINNIPNYLIQTWPLADEIGRWNSNGLVLGIYTDVKKSCDLLSNLKHNNFLPYAMAAMHAKKQKWNDALLLNTDGRLCDTSIANIFLIKDEVIYTPALPEGCIAGIMRKNVIDHLKEGNYKIIEGKISVDDLFAADEVFLTNSIYNIRWVQGIGDKKYTNIETQKIYTAVFSTNS
ncbi:MAG: aminotransferase class IV [Ferruginibacter sp.]